MPLMMAAPFLSDHVWYCPLSELMKNGVGRGAPADLRPGSKLPAPTAMPWTAPCMTVARACGSLASAANAGFGMLKMIAPASCLGPRYPAAPAPALNDCQPSGTHIAPSTSLKRTECSGAHDPLARLAPARWPFTYSSTLY